MYVCACVYTFVYALPADIFNSHYELKVYIKFFTNIYIYINHFMTHWTFEKWFPPDLRPRLTFAPTLLPLRQ